MLDLSEPLKETVARLRNDISLTNIVLSSRIVNHRQQVDPDTVLSGDTLVTNYLPFILVSYEPGNDLGGKDFQGLDGEIVLNIWVEEQSDKKALDIATICNSLLHNITLNLVSSQNVLMQHSQTILIRETNNLHHVVQRFRFLNFN